MEEREIAESVEKQPYFEAVTVPQESEQDDGTREMGELYPFLISGGTNTERYYFTHINDKTDYKFNIRPRYFGDESNYTKAFPKRINEVLSANNDAKVFCVFDWDTIYGDEAKLKKVDIHEGLNSTLDLISHETKSRITIKKEYSNLPEINCYPDYLNQVFMNILMKN